MNTLTRRSLTLRTTSSPSQERCISRTLEPNRRTLNRGLLQMAIVSKSSSDESMPNWTTIGLVVLPAMLLCPKMLQLPTYLSWRTSPPDPSTSHCIQSKLSMVSSHQLKSINRHYLPSLRTMVSPRLHRTGLAK